MSALALVTAVAISLLIASPAAATPERSGAVAKKRCHVVAKKVHGKKKRVRVCGNAKRRQVKNVSVSLDQGRAASATLGKAGGTISATAANGTKLTLAIPAGSLLETTKITLTPVGSLRGLPNKVRLVAAAQFAPEGLVLAKTATLTFTTPKAAAARALSWFERGRDVSRYPSNRSGASVQISVLHFSGGGVGRGPVSAWNQLPDATTALRRRFQTTIKPLLQRGLTDDSDAVSALSEGAAWVNEVHELVLARSLAKEDKYVRTQLQSVFENAVRRALSKCVGHDLGAFVSIERLSYFAHLSDYIDVGELDTHVVTDAEDKCLRFELDMVFFVSWGWSYHQEDVDGTIDSGLNVEARRIPLKLAFHGAANPLDPALDAGAEGEGPIQLKKWYMRGEVSGPDAPPCTGSEGSGTSATEPLQSSLLLELDALSQLPTSLTLRVEPGDIGGLAWHFTCPVYGGLPAINWSYRNLFQELVSPPVTSWTYQGNGRWQSRTFQRHWPTGIEPFWVGGHDGSATFFLRHVPRK